MVAAFFMPVFKNSKQDQHKDICGWVNDVYLEGVTAAQRLREDTRKRQDMVYGDIFDPETKFRLNEQGLPALEFNIILPKIIRVMGAERNARSGIKAVPLKRGRNETAKAFTQLFEMARVNSSPNGFMHIRDAFIDAVIGDLPGWLKILWNVDNDPLGYPIYKRVHNLDVIWDIKAKEYDLRDSRYLLETWWSTKADVIRDFPHKVGIIEKHLEDMRQGNLSAFMQDTWERIRGPRENLDHEFVNRKENLFRLIQCQKREEVRETRLYDPEMQITERPKDKEELEVLKEANPRFLEIDWKQDKIRVITTVAGDLELEDVDAEVQNGMFSHIPIWAYEFGGRSFGMVKNLTDPTMLFTKETNNLLHISTFTANPWTLIPKGSVTPEVKKDIEKHGARAGLLIEWDPSESMGHKPERISAQTSGMPAELADRGETLAEKISGIGQNAVGRADSNDESGKLVQTRISETVTMLESLFDNKMYSMVLLHRYLIDLFREKVGLNRMLRWVSDSSGTVQDLLVNLQTAHGILNDLNEGEYGIGIEKSEAIYFRQEKFLKLTMLANIIGPMPELVELMINAFDEIDEQEKAKVVSAFKMQAAAPILQELEQQLTGQMEGDRNRRMAQGQEVDNQLQALEGAAAI